MDVIQRCASILQVLASGRKVNSEKFDAYCIETAKKLVHLYGWYYLPASVHKILIHGAKIIEHFMVPIGQLSEEAQESMNKIIRQTRAFHSRKNSRISTNTDLLHRLLELSDPLITINRVATNKKNEPFSNDARYLLDMNDSSTESDSDDSESD